MKKKILLTTDQENLKNRLEALASQIRQEVLDEATQCQLAAYKSSPNKTPMTVSSVLKSSPIELQPKDEQARPETKKKNSPMHKLFKQTHFSKKRVDRSSGEAKKSVLDRSLMSQKSMKFLIFLIKNCC
jgi:hypothetical protein